MQPLISVVIPLYNVEPFLRECLDSVVGQTYRNLEIILVDDGSTDKSGGICDEYAAADSRIRVIHQPNGGVAAARNRGLCAVTGDYIAWVDSDDVCAPDMVQYLYKGLTEHAADMSQCGRTSIRAVYDSAEKKCSGGKATVLSVGADIFRALVHNEIGHNVTFKLYAAHLYEGVSFPNLSYGEDSCGQYQLLKKMKRVTLLPEIKYYYRLRPGSLSHSYRLEDCLRLQTHVYELLGERHDHSSDWAVSCLLYRFAHFTSETLATIRKSQRPEKALVDQAFSQIRKNKQLMLDCPQIGRLGRLEIRAICTGRPWSWHFAAWCQRAYELRAERRTRKNA